MSEVLSLAGLAKNGYDVYANGFSDTELEEHLQDIKDATGASDLTLPALGVLARLKILSKGLSKAEKVIKNNIELLTAAVCQMMEDRNLKSLDVQGVGKFTRVTAKKFNITKAVTDDEGVTVERTSKVFLETPNAKIGLVLNDNVIEAMEFFHSVDETSVINTQVQWQGMNRVCKEREENKEEIPLIFEKTTKPEIRFKEQEDG